MFMCDPFGRSDPESVVNFGSDNVHEHNYIFFFDQEPIHLNYHMPTFDEIIRRNDDIRGARGAICTSERDSDNVDALCAKYGWRSYYYFFHGWAALDWYRGYDKTFLIKTVAERKPTKTFIAPNRIIAGERQHRLEVLYHIFRNGMTNNHISCPEVCPAENISIYDAVKRLPFGDAESVFRSADLPINFAGEIDHPMHSCWLSLFDEAADSLLYLVTETVATGRRHHITEKTFKPIALGMPFIIVGTKGSLEYLRSYGFKTFDGIWDESYDTAEDDVRIERIASLLRSLDELTPEGRQDLFEMAHPIIEHNWNHFYNGGFEQVLWRELQEMLNGIESSSGQDT
jgi:hypothetical protein